MWPTRISVCTASFLSITITRRVASGGSVIAGAGTSAGFHAPKCFSRPAIASAALMSPTTAISALLGTKYCLVEVHEVGARQRRPAIPRCPRRACRRDGSRRSADRSRDRRPTPGSSAATFNADSACCALPLDLFRRERRPLHDVGHQIERDVVAVLHHDGVDEAQVGAGAGAEHAADEVDRLGDLLGAALVPAP